MCSTRGVAKGKLIEESATVCPRRDAAHGQVSVSSRILLSFAFIATLCFASRARVDGHFVPLDLGEPFAPRPTVRCGLDPRYIAFFL